jgi:translation elongation factor EF-1alpha
MPGKYIGSVSRFIDEINLAVVNLQETIHVGDKVRILGPSSDFQQEVPAIQIKHKQVDEAGPGEQVGLMVKNRVDLQDKVYKVFE